MKNKIDFISKSINEISFKNKLSELTSIDVRTNGYVCLKMSDGKKLLFTEEGKTPFTNEKTGEEVFEYSGTVVDGNKDKSWAIAYFKEGNEGKEGGYSPKHHHDVQTEVYFIISGEARLVIDDKEYFLKAGDSMEITPGQKHQIFNIGKTKMALVVECTPAWTLGDYLLDEEIIEKGLEFN